MRTKSVRRWRITAVLVLLVFALAGCGGKHSTVKKAEGNYLLVAISGVPEDLVRGAVATVTDLGGKGDSRTLEYAGGEVRAFVGAITPGSWRVDLSIEGYDDESLYVSIDKEPLTYAMLSPQLLTAGVELPTEERMGTER